MSIGTIWTYRDLIKREQGLEAAIEFEQVVKKYQAEQIAIEQERIIKLLDECVCGASVEKCMTCECNERKIKRVDLIALIKGKK